MPLAVKCLLLFGTGVLLVLGAALWFPWQRMEQLTQQLDQKAGGAVVRQAVGEHISIWTSSAATTRPANLWQKTVEPLIVDGEKFLPPRLIPVEALDQSELLTRFDLQSFQQFAADGGKKSHGRYFLDGNGYRYAEPLYAVGECLPCHQPHDPPASWTRLVSSMQIGEEKKAASIGGDDPATQPAAQLLGIVSIEIPSQIEKQQLLLNRIFMLSAGVIAGMVAIVVFYLITTRLVLQPVRVLQETCEKVSQGDLNIRSDVNTGDEFQQLSETFNAMLKNLQESADQLRAVNKSLDLKLGQLAETNVALYESNRLKSEFLANVSHELRTPLTSILGFADLLTETVGRASDGDGKAARYLQNIAASGRGLLQLINELLDLAKIEAGRMEVRSEPLSLGDLFEGLTSVLKPLAERRNLLLRAHVSNDVPILQTDPAKVQQILYNFLSNAIKFSPQGQTIDLTAKREGLLSIRIDVVDRGPGIPPDKLGILFEKFRQVDASHTREHGGTGLGLAIAKELATLLGGTVGVESNPGAGSTFWLVLPLRITAESKDVRGKMVLT